MAWAAESYARGMSDSEMDPESRALLASLSSQRTHVLGILEGLSDDELRRPVLPSGWSCLGLVQHLALDVERFWFQAVMEGEHDVLGEGPEDPWQVAAEVSADAVLAGYREQAERSDAYLAVTPLDTPPAWWPNFFGDYRLDTFREVLLHVITETATHAGHLDAARELIDGRTWLVLT